MTSLDAKLEQIENGFETGLEKLGKESETKQKNSVSELECKIKVNLLDMECHLLKEIETFNSKIDVLKEEESKFEFLLNGLMIKTDSNQELIQSIDKELGRQLKELASKSEIEQLKSNLKTFVLDLNQKMSPIEEGLNKFGDDIKSTKNDLNSYKQEFNAKLENNVDHFKQNLIEIRSHLEHMCSNVSDLSVEQTKNEEKFSKVDKFFGEMSELKNRSKNFEHKMTEIEGTIQQLGTNAENDRMELFEEIHSNVKNLGENLRHRSENFLFSNRVLLWKGWIRLHKFIEKTIKYTNKVCWGSKKLCGIQ